MIDKQHRDFLRQGRDDIEDDVTLRGRNSSSGFVEQQSLRTQRQRNSDFEKTLPAVWQ